MKGPCPWAFDTPDALRWCEITTTWFGRGLDLLGGGLFYGLEGGNQRARTCLLYIPLLLLLLLLCVFEFSILIASKSPRKKA
jgi:hypothetical protein